MPKRQLETSSDYLQDLDHISYFVDGAQRYSQYRLHIPLENLNTSPDLFDGGPTATFYLRQLA